MSNNFWQKIDLPPHQRNIKIAKYKKQSFWCGGRPILALAPMAGVTDSAFRQICAELGADVTYSEMASVSALFFNPHTKGFDYTKPKSKNNNFGVGVNPNHTLELVKFKKAERPYIVQLFGKDPEHFAASARIITERIKPDGIDINFGCPAKKVFGHGSGCALMPEKKLAREIISAVCENTDLPVSIKIRAGVKNMNAVKFVENTKDLPYSAIMIHGRTYEGNFSGPVDFSICEQVKKIASDKIVLGNGGINTPEDAVEILKKYPLLDGLGIARGSWGKPWIFQEIKRKIHPVEYAAKRRPPKAEFNRVKKIMIRHAELIYENKGKRGIFEIRKHMCWYVKGFPGAAELRKKLVEANSVKEIKKILK